MSTRTQDFFKATITRNWTATTGDFNVSVAPTVVPGIIVISPQSSSTREMVRYTAVGTNGYGPYVTVSNISDRGLSGTTAQSHIIGENIRMNITAEHWKEMQDDIDSIVAAGLPPGSDGQCIVNNLGVWVAGNRLLEEELKIATISISSAELKALAASPKTLINAPGAGKIIILEDVIFAFTYVAPQYTLGGDLEIRYSSGTSNYFQLPTETLAIRGTADFVQQFTRNGGAYTYPKINNSVILKNAGAEFATGSGTVNIFIKYRILTL
jgi:hypothetical protein